MMKTIKVINQDACLWDRISLADTPLTRLRGLLGKRALAPGEGLLLSPCSQVHGFMMRFPIDVVFLARNNQILHSETLEPGKISRHVKGAVYVLEIAAGDTERCRLKNGDILEFRS
ncbi:MAG: DUF192 domain-containing protein [Clostridiaceae bacterium]|nr:DUF192 domain-containing protein [Clostridiaceae bacterium]